MSKPRSAYTSNVRRDGLTPSQERAIRAMLTARSIAAAARQADVGQSTLRRWLREDDNFQNKLRQFREQALSHAALLLQQGAARAVAIMDELIQSGRPIEPGRVLLIRTAIEYAFRSAVYCDIIERVKALEKAQRQPADRNPRQTPTRIQPQNGAARVSKRFPLVRDQTVWETSTSQSPQPQKVNFPKPARSSSNPTVKQRRNFSGSAPACSLRTPGRPRDVAPALMTCSLPARFSHREAKCVRGPSVRGARRLTSGGVSPCRENPPHAANWFLSGHFLVGQSP